MRRRFLALVFLTCVGCVSRTGPTLPLPPPTAAIFASVDGVVTLRGQGTEGALVNAFNITLDTGTIGRVDDMGNYEVMVRADSGDRIEIWQTIGSDTGPSDPTTVTVP